MPFTIERNDLAAVEADAIVVAANEQLQITGGVGLAVAQVAGLAEMQAACDEIGGCPCGGAVATPGYRLHAGTVVHAVGPVWQGGGYGEIELLRGAYAKALECAVEHGAGSVALPLISAGTYGFPADVSLAVARESIRAFLNTHDDVDVHLVLYSRESVAAGIAAYLDIAEYVDDHYVSEHPAAGYAQASSMFPQGAVPTVSASEPQERWHGRREQGRLLARLGEAVDTVRGRSAAERADDPSADAFVPATEAVAGAAEPVPAAQADTGMSPRSLEELLDELDAPFSTTLLALIDERNLTDAQVYKRANMSRQLFSKIRSDAAYRPTKKTVLALCVALCLNLDETRDLLARAGFALSNSSKADVIVEYFIGNGNCDIFEVNEALYAFDQPLL